MFFRIPITHGFVHADKVLFSWKDQIYRDFMLEVLSALEPRFDEKGTILYDELDEFLEVLFVMKGQIIIGYECNKKRKFCIRHNYGCIIGDFGCTLN